MADSCLHARELQEYVLDVLRDRFEDDADVYVSGNNFIYFVEGDPAAGLSADASAVRGVPGLRRTFKVWEEGGRRPCVVIEITSRKTRGDDRGRKREIYARRLSRPSHRTDAPDE